jgi:hypothetical protein
LAYASYVIKHKTNSKPSGQKQRKVVRQSYTPISDALSQPNTLADNEFAEGFSRFGLKGLLARCMNKDRRSDGVELSQIMMTLLVWPLLDSPSIHCFCNELCHYIRLGSKVVKRPASVIYDLWKREDINWRNLACVVSGKVASKVDLGDAGRRAFVVDDSIKERRGKKVEGSSRHYDHNSGRSIQGHQVLELGIAGERGFIPIDRQIFTGESHPVEKAPERGFQDNRSAAARDMKRAREEDKNQMLGRMIKGALKVGHKASYLLGDAWFGIKDNIALAIDNGLKAIFQMKRGKLTYRVGRKDYTATQLHALHERKMKGATRKSRYKTARIKARINLQTSPGAEPRWQSVVLVLSAPNDGSHNRWVIFLSTDLDVSAEDILEIYALRWSIEVYFKEVKQNFGLLAEQSGKYQVAYASVHLAAVRYLLIFEAMQRNGSLSFGEERDLQSGKLLAMSYASLLWGLFRSIITGVFDQLEAEMGKATIEKLTNAIDGAVESFLNEAFHMTPSHMKGLQRAEASGML